MHIVTDSKYVVDGMTKWLPKWERVGWVDVSNSDLLQELVALLRTRSATTTFRWVKGHSGDPGNDGADRLAKEGARKARPHLPLHLPAPRRFLKCGVEMASLTQSLAYRAITLSRQQTVNEATAQRVKIVIDEVQRWSGHALTPMTLWNSLRSDVVEPKVRDFIWKTLHGAYRVSSFWARIPGAEQRAVCSVCGVTDDMTHILTKCVAPGQREMWESARHALLRAGVCLPPTPCLGLYLGAPALSIVGENGKERHAATRLTRIVLSETAHAVWAARCERVVQWQQEPHRVHSLLALKSRWTAALDKRLWLDQQRTRLALPGRRPLTVSVVESTWEPLLDPSIDRLSNWVRLSGVLVGRQV
ncbi:hypothetical protein C8Q70DRAFT_927226 [Cubamyces menziesii]|nr:hypothetical protein C8Q70DRAFT_927226 [Cubamyces menziesii]